MATSELRQRTAPSPAPSAVEDALADGTSTVEKFQHLFGDMEIAKPSKRKAARALLVSVGMSVLGYVFLAMAPWYLMPVAWVLIGTAVTGLSAVAYDCSNHTFTKYQLVNDIIGMLCMVPLCLPFESWRHNNSPVKNGLSRSTFFWWFSSGWDWIKANFVFSLSKKLVLNLVCVYAFVCLFFPLMAYNLGWWGLVKFYFIPFLVYHFWPFALLILVFGVLPLSDMLLIRHQMSTFIKNGAFEELSTTEYPRWVGFLSNNMNLVYTSAAQNMPSSVASYNVRQALEDVRAAADELKLEIEQRSFSDVFSMSWTDDVNWPTTIFLFATPALGIYGLLTTPFYWQTYAVSFISYFSGGLAITTAYHRCFSHRSYDMNRPAVIIWTMLATQTFEGSVLEWCQDHRAHHRYTDTPNDPYDIIQGFWNAHMGWLIRKRDRWTTSKADISDLKADWFFRFQHKYYTPLAFLCGIFIPMAICGFGWGDWRGGFFNAGIFSVVLTMQCTFCINSLAHYWGDATFTDERTPRDSALVSLVTFGEGYHNFHHEFPYDYRNGVHATAYDPAKWWIWAAEKLGVAWNVKRFDHDTIEKGRLTMRQKSLDKLKAQYDWGTPVEDLPVVTWEELLARREVVADAEPEYDDDGKYVLNFHTANFMVINDVVHDVTDFVSKHPGGRAFVQTYTGRDATKAFTGGVYAHSLGAKNLLATLRIARVVGEQPEHHH